MVKTHFKLLGLFFYTEKLLIIDLRFNFFIKYVVFKLPCPKLSLINSVSLLQADMVTSFSHLL